MLQPEQRKETTMQIHMRVIAPAFSLGVISEEVKSNASKNIRSQGWELSFGRHIQADNDGSIESIKRRVQDIHEALIDHRVTHLIAVIGGWDSHELLPFIDWELWRKYPKPLIGYSDITSLQTAAYTMSGVTSIHGPTFSTLGQPSHLEYSLRQLTECLSGKRYVLEPAGFWIDDEWFLDLMRERVVHAADDVDFLKSGEATGTALGSNLSTFIALAGTRYFPDLSGKILLLEDIESVPTQIFRRMFLQLLKQPGAEEIKGILFGRPQTRSPIDWYVMLEMVKHFALNNVPIVVNASFGHTYPVGSFPIGRQVSIESVNGRPQISAT